MRLILATICLVLSAYMPAHAECDVPSDEVLESILRVVGENPEGNMVQGSAVVVSNNRVITAAHVVNDLAHLNIRIGTRSRPAQVIFTSTDRDIALLEVDTSGLHAVRFAEKRLNANDQVWAIGYPLGGNLTSSAGEFVKKLNPYKLHTTAEVNHGQSGGGLISCSDGNYTLAGMIISYGAVVRDGEYVRLPDYSVAVTTDEVSSLITIMEPDFALTKAD